MQTSLSNTPRRCSPAVKDAALARALRTGSLRLYTPYFMTCDGDDGRHKKCPKDPTHILDTISPGKTTLLWLRHRSCMTGLGNSSGSAHLRCHPQSLQPFQEPSAMFAKLSEPQEDSRHATLRRATASRPMPSSTLQSGNPLPLRRVSQRCALNWTQQGPVELFQVLALGFVFSGQGLRLKQVAQLLTPILLKRPETRHFPNSGARHTPPHLLQFTRIV